MNPKDNILSDSLHIESLDGTNTTLHSQPPIYDNITNKTPSHDCKQEERINRLEKRQDESIQSIDSKLEKIWTAVNHGDTENTKNLITVVGIFVAALVSITIGFVAIIKLL
jgi:hypothetical protein